MNTKITSLNVQYVYSYTAYIMYTVVTITFMHLPIDFYLLHQVLMLGKAATYTKTTCDALI